MRGFRAKGRGSRRSALWAIALVLFAGRARAQVATGSIVGVLTDASGGGIANAELHVANQETGQARSATTSSDGRYSVESLAPGAYRLQVQLEGFKTLEQTVSVETGTVTTVDSVLEPGTVTEVVTVSGMAPVIRRDQYVVGGLVTRTQIERLPLNGRNFLELAKLEPGVIGPSRLADNRTFVAPLGAGLQTIPRIGYTRITVDGASITTPGTAGVLLQVSQDVVQEFQMSTVNFDPAISLTTNGAMNIVTRAGGNQFRGGGFLLYRDHHLAAYPALRRDPANPDPFFRREQYGGDVGGPLITNRAFFFASYERNEQTGVMSVQPASPDFAGLGGIFTTPYRGQLMNARVDVVSPSHTVFVRYTHDGNHTFANAGPANSLPSAWSQRTIRANQSLVALTSVLTTQLVNDARLSFLSVSSPDGPGRENDCPGCFGLGVPRIGFTGAEITIGNPRTLTSDSRRWQMSDGLTWQETRHRIRAGIDWEHVTSATSLINQDPVQLTLWSPSQVRLLNPAIPLPSSFTTLDDILQLPLRSFQTTVGPSVVPQRGFSDTRVQDLVRLYVSDTWHAASRLTVNGGLAWSLEPNALNYDLSKPALLAPLLGAGRLDPPAVHYKNFSPTLGLAWTATADGKTVVRGGAGRYFDPVASSNKGNLDNERASLLPLGTVRLSATGSNGLCGRVLDFRQPTSFTGAQLMSLLPCIRADLLRSTAPDNRDFSVRTIDSTKAGINLYDPSYSTPYAVHVGVGVQRELPAGLVISADGVWKRFVHTFINGLDYNHWDSVRGPVIPACSTAAQQQDVHAICSNGGLYFDTTIGRARYAGLLVRIEKRFSGRAQLLASYALGSFVGSNGTGVASNGMAVGTSEATGGRVFGFNNDNWSENYGPLPTDQRHILNVSGFIELPRQFQLAFEVAAYSRPPFSAYVNGMDFNGDGTVSDLLPGTRINQFGRGLDRDDLERLVLAYNQQYAGRITTGGQIAQPITLPDRYAFDDNFFTQDVRVSRAFAVGQNKWRLLVFGEVFNLFNTANLALFSGNLLDRTVFGQPSTRATQVFGSGGPRAFQLGTRVTF